MYRKEVLKSTEISKDVDDKELEQAVRFLHDNGQVMSGVTNVVLTSRIHYRYSTTL